MLKYKGLEGTCKYDKELRSFVGELKNTKFLVVYKGTSMKDLERNFKKSVEQYLSSVKVHNKGEMI